MSVLECAHTKDKQHNDFGELFTFFCDLIGATKIDRPGVDLDSTLGRTDFGCWRTKYCVISHLHNNTSPGRCSLAVKWRLALK